MRKSALGSNHSHYLCLPLRETETFMISVGTPRCWRGTPSCVLRRAVDCMYLTAFWRSAACAVFLLLGRLMGLVRCKMSSYFGFGTTWRIFTKLHFSVIASTSGHTSLWWGPVRPSRDLKRCAVGPLCSLMSYIYMSCRTANLQMLHFKYLFNKYPY
jgi:hypothetical protein